MTEINLAITGLGAQGDGLAQHQGKNCFVTGALAGEEVRARVLPPADKTLRAVTIAAEKPSPDRVPAPCPHFLTCGGCKLQHFAPAPMTAWKENGLRSLFAREGIDLPPFLPAFVTPPASRRRARFAALHTKNGVIIGFNEERSRTIVDLQACPVLRQEIVDLLPRLRQAIASWLPKAGTCDIHVTLLDQGLDLVLIGGRALDLDSREKLARIAEDLDLARLGWRKWDRSPIEPIAERSPLFVTFGDQRVSFPAASFLQATAEGEQALFAFARRAAKGSKHLADLFCGLGGFGLSIDGPKKKYFADLDGPAIDQLGKAVRGKAGFQSAERNLLREALTPFELEPFDTVIFDPPRGGAKTQAIQLAQSQVPNVIAISCDPPSLARDAKILIGGGYRCAEAQMIDQFLWSPHTEMATLFTKV